MAVIHQGCVLVTGEPAALVAGLEGKVWRKIISSSELAAHRERFQIILVRLFAGQTLVHAWSDTNPGDGFEPVEPDLEDLYFATIHGIAHLATSPTVN